MRWRQRGCGALRLARFEMTFICVDRWQVRSSDVQDCHQLWLSFIILIKYSTLSLLHCYNSAYDTQVTLRRKRLGTDILVLVLS